MAVAKDERREPAVPHEEPPGSPLSAERGRPKERARNTSPLAQKRGRLKHVVGALGNFARRFGRRRAG